MNRVSATIFGVLIAIAAVEFGLLGASAAGITGDRDDRLPRVVERFGEPVTATATLPPEFTPTGTPGTGPPQLSPPSVVSGITIIADPLAIHCDGSETSRVRVRIVDVNGQPAPDGINVYFEAYNGNTEPYFAQTVNGYAETNVRFYDDIFPYGPNVIVRADLLEAGIRILCFPQSDECPLSPPAVSPPCGPTPISPPDGCPLSPPAVSPPCETPTTPPVSPPPAPTRTRTPGRTATAPVPTATRARPTRTPSSVRCADVTGNGRVTGSDVLIIGGAVHRREYRPAYDINGDGRLSQSDVNAAVKQLGRRC